MDRAIADLKDKVEAIIGPVTVKGVDPKPHNNLDTLSSGDDTFGHLDGLAYGPPGQPADGHGDDRRPAQELADAAQDLVGQGRSEDAAARLRRR